MKILLLNTLALLLTLSNARSYESRLHPQSDEFINLVNQKATTWKAGRNFERHTSMKYLKTLLGLKPNALFNGPRVSQPVPEDFALPASFDSREAWPNCPTIREIRDQGCCGSCWAVSSVSVMSDRQCIYSKGKSIVHYSTEDLVSCCDSCGHGCEGGDPVSSFQYWISNGIVSGGPYNSSQGCYPYEVPTTDTCSKEIPTPECHRKCEPGYKTSYAHDLHYGKSFHIAQGAMSYMLEMVKGGPIVVAFAVYYDFFHYKSGIYRHVDGGMAGLHAVRLVGYGTENGVRYWLVANSWGEDWGEKGFFKILRGNNECGIEMSGVLGIPLLQS